MEETMPDEGWRSRNLQAKSINLGRIPRGSTEHRATYRMAVSETRKGDGGPFLERLTQQPSGRSLHRRRDMKRAPLVTSTRTGP